MTFGPKRGHIACIFDHFFKDFGLLLVAILVSVVSGDMDILAENIGILIIVLLGPIARLMVYFTTYYSIDEEKVVIRSGLFKKSALEMPISTITTVDFSQNVFHQIFGVYKLTVDNSSNISNSETKVHMTLKKDDAEMVKKLLIKGRNGLDGLNYASEIVEEKGVEAGTDTEPVIAVTTGRKYEIRNIDLLLMGALKSKGVYLIELLGGLAAILAFVPMPEDAAFDAAFDQILEMGIGVFFLIVVVFFFVLSIAMGAAGSMIRYYGYKVLDNGEAIKVEYGLFDRKTYTLPKKKISGCYYEQSGLMRLAKLGSVHIMAVGYGTDSGEETSEEALLFPLMPVKKVKNVIGEIMPEMADEGKYQKAEKKALGYFFLRFSVAFSLGVLLASPFLQKAGDFFHNSWIIGAFFLLLALIGSVLHYHSAAVYGTPNHFSMVYGGFKKTTVFVKTKMIESMEASGSVWKQKRGFANIAIGCIAPMGLSEQRVENMPVSIYENLKEYLIY